MSKIRKLMVVCAMALMMMVVALPSALAQDYFAWEPYYYDPSWTSTPASTDTTATEENPDVEDCFIVENDEGGEFLVCERD